MAAEDLRNNEMMAWLMDSLEKGRDIGHYGRLTFAMVARSFMEPKEIVGWLAKGADCDEEKAQTLLAQIEGRGYNPPKRERVLEWMQKQKFPICPHPQDPRACNVYRDLEFPSEIYDNIQSFYQSQTAQDNTPAKVRARPS